MNEFDRLLEILPPLVRHIINNHKADDLEDFEIIEIILDISRDLEIRFANRSYQIFKDVEITEEDIAYVTANLNKFGPDDRTGINGTLHRISKIEDRNNKIMGLTIRIGKDLSKGIALLGEENVINKSILILGKPSAGKTSTLRSIARFLSLEAEKQVIIVDTSNEIAGEGEIPHRAIGRSRRMQVPLNSTQAQIMVRAVENHNPEVIIIDEIGNSEEAEAALTIGQRGVQIIGTAHGKTLQDLIENKPLSALIGETNKVTISDETMNLTGAKSKTQLNRVQQPPFSVLIEIISFDEIRIYSDLTKAIDTILSGGTAQPEERRIKDGHIIVTQKEQYTPAPNHNHSFQHNNEEESSFNKLSDKLSLAPRVPIKRKYHRRK